jgi:hypothetical protein
LALSAAFDELARRPSVRAAVRAIWGRMLVGWAELWGTERATSREQRATTSAQ